MPSLDALRDNVPFAWRHARSWLIDLVDETINIVGGTPTTNYASLTGQAAAPAAPAAGDYRLYITTTGLVRHIDSASVVRELVDLSSAQTITGVKTINNPIISGGSINNTPIGATTATSGRFNILTIAAGVGTARILDWHTASSVRWRMFATATAESGGDAGSDFIFQRFSDAGVGATVFSIVRSTGALTINPPVTINSTLNTTGDIRLAGSAAVNTIFIDGGAGQWKILRFRTGLASRWAIQSNSTAESGSNAGSDFVISRYDDAGVVIDNTFNLQRSTGAATLSASLTILGLTPNTASAPNNLVLEANSTGAPANGFGVAFLMRAETTTTPQTNMFQLSATYPVVNHATRTVEMLFSVFDFAAQRVALRLGANGSAATIGFLGAGAVIRQVVTGSRGGNAALASLLTGLANLGLITDSTSA